MILEGEREKAKRKIPVTVAPGFHLLVEDPLLFLIRPKRKKNKNQKRRNIQQPLAYIPFEKRSIILSLSNKCSQNPYLSKDSPLCNCLVFLPLLLLSLISSVVWEVFPHPILHCFKAKWKDSQDTQLHYLAYLPMKLNAMKEGVNGSWIYSELIHFSSK